MTPDEYISMAISTLDAFGVVEAIQAVLAVTIAFAFVNAAFNRGK